MDDFDYSLHISDQDWDTFYQECEACNLLSPGLASREDSGMSDIDEMGCHLLDLTRLPASAEADLDGPPDCEGSPVDHYLSKYGIRSPEQVLSGSEEDLHLQTVNLFFERLKSVTVNEQPLEQSHAANCQSEKMDHLAGLNDKQVIQSIGICPSGRNAASLKGEITKQGEADTWGSTALEKPIMTTFTNAQARASDSTERETAVEGGSLSSHLITVGMKQEQEKRCYHLSCTESTELKQKPETKPPDKPKMANWTNVTDSNPAGESIAQLNTGNISDSNDSPVCQFPVSPPNLRRKRRKKKRMSSEPGEPGHGYEAQFRVHQSESEEERFIQREVMNSLPTHFLKREHLSLPRVQMSSVSFNNENLPLCFNVASTDLKCSKNLPLSFTNFGFDTKTQVGRTSMYNISKYTNDISLVNSGQLKAEVCQKSILPQMDTVLHIQENDVEVNQIQTDSGIQLKDTPSSPSIKETLSVSQSDKSAAGCQRKSLLSPNISSAADSTEPLSSSVSLNLAVDACKDVSCMGNEIDCCAFKSEQSSPSKWKMTGTSDTQQSNLSMTENIDETESCLDGNSPKRFSQKGELVPPTDIQQINNSSEVLNMNSSLIKPGSLTEESESKLDNSVTEDVNIYHAVEEKRIGELSDKTTSSSEHMHGVKIPEHTSVSDHRKDEGHIQSIDYSSEISIVNTSLIQPENSTEESKGKRYNGVNEDANLYRAVEDKSIGKLCDETTRSSKHIHGLNIPDNNALSGNGKDGHILSIINSSEISIVNTSLIQPENSIEESEGKRYNSVSEDANLYHAVEEKIIGGLSDKTTSSSEQINGLKIPEDPAVSDHGNDESYIQQINNSSEVLNMNSSLIKQGSLREELESKVHSSGIEDVNLYHAVEEKSIGELSDKTTSSSEHINGLKIPEDHVVSDHRNHEEHIQSINNSSEKSIVNTSLIQPENSIEESEGKRYNSVNEDAKLYHAVEDKIIGELSDKTTSSSEHKHDLKIPEDPALSDHGNNESHIQHINNHSEVLNMNSSCKKSGSLTEEPKGIGHSFVSDDASLYHAVEYKSIGELCDETATSSKHIDDLKVPKYTAVSDHGKADVFIQSINNSSEISIVNSSPIQPEYLTEDSESKGRSSVNEDANLYHEVEDKGIGKVCDETTRSSKHIDDLKRPEDIAVSNHGNDEGHIKKINDSSEALNMNSSLIKPGNLTEESECKGHNSGTEDANLYHVVEEKSISELSDKATSSSEHIHGLKIPEDHVVSDHRKDEEYMQNMNNSTEISIVNTSLIQPKNSTEESEGKRYNIINEDANLYHVVEEKSIGELSDETTSSSEHIHGLKIPEHTSISDHEKDEGHLQSINNRSEILIVNTSLIQPKNSTEESESKGHNSVNEDVNLYHAVEKNIGELNDKTISSGEHIHGLKMPEHTSISDHEKDEGQMQSINNSSEILIANTSLIQPENLTEESEEKRYNSVNEDAHLYRAVEDKSIGELSDETTRSSKHIDDLKRPEDIAVNDEGHIQHMNNSSEVLKMNSSLLKPGNLTEESEVKGHNSVKEDDNLYHAVEDRSIGELCDETTRSSEHIDDLKRPEHIAVSDHGNDEGHIQHINNSSDVLNINTAIIKLGNSTEDSEVKGQNSVSEEDKSIGELCNLTSTSSEHTCDHKKEIEMLSEDSTQNALADVSDSKSIDPESIVLNAPDQSPCPVYAISSFWNEMEKLTINDILRLRMISHAQHPSVLTQPEDGSIADATDAADSGYFTQPDDSKPDRLSEDMSFISDLDEDFTLQTPDCIKQEESSCELPSSPCSVTWQNDSDPAIVGDDVVFVNSETIVPEHLCKSDTQQCFRKICKNISVQNLQALESQPVRQMLRNASLHSIHSEVEDPFYHVNTSYTTCLSDDEEVDSGGISFSEIIQYFLGDNKPERCPSRADNAESNLEETCTSVPEMYDNFFSEFDSRSFFSPFEDESSGKDKMVPIFSCNRSGNHQFPEAYDYFFPDSPVHSDEDDENDNASIKVVTHKSTYPFEVESGEKDEVVPIFSCTRSRKHQFPEAYDYFFPDSPGHSDEDDENDNAPIKVVTHKSTNHYPVDTCEHSNPNQGSFFWTNLFSFRRVQRTGPSNLEEKSYSCALTPVKPLRKGIKSVTVMGPDDKPFPDTLYLNLENHIFQQLTEQQKKCLEMQTIIADPRLDAPFLPLRQADMCLVCIAFASWVLKSASPGADTWKAALLANISALSAIRYLRRHKREETSLRQIEPS